MLFDLNSILNEIKYVYLYIIRGYFTITYVKFIDNTYDIIINEIMNTKFFNLIQQKKCLLKKLEYLHCSLKTYNMKRIFKKNNSL